MSRKTEALALLQDIIIAIIVVVIVLGSLWAYGGRWPPMVVVESESMQHAHDESSVGVIDTGDLTLVRTLEKSDGVVTWVEGRETGYTRYDDFGDVIVYHKNGLRETTPIIHRALVRVVWNETEEGFDVPSLNEWGVTGTFIINDLTSYHNGFRETIDLTVNVQTIIANFQSSNPPVEPHDGIITKGDHNHDVDQATLPSWNGLGGRPPGVTNLVEPVRDGWIVGVARGEIPWFGLIKLWAKGQTKDNPAPANSGYNLVISVALLLVGPFLAESAIIEYRKMRPKEDDKKRGKRRRGKEDEDELRGPFVWVYRTIKNALTGKVD